MFIHLGITAGVVDIIGVGVGGIEISIIAGPRTGTRVGKTAPVAVVEFPHRAGRRPVIAVVMVVHGEDFPVHGTGVVHHEEYVGIDLGTQEQRSISQSHLGSL